MRLVVINCVFLACAAAALAEERPRRHLHKIKELIVNKLFTSSEPCAQPAPALETKFFSIPGFKDVVIKAVPKGSEPAPILEKIPPNSHIGIVGSYLGTSTLNETYNALLGVKNLLTSGILGGKPEVLQEVGLVPSKVKIVAKPLKPCGAPSLRPLPLEPVRVLVKPPILPVIPTQYSYKQVNQDGSLTTYTSSLDFANGVRVTEGGKTLPFIIDRVRKIPVDLPVPLLPEISKIVVSAPRPAYSYQQIYEDGRMSSYMGLPSLISQPGPVVVTETGARIPPPPVFLIDRIEKVAAIASYSRAPFAVPKPVEMNSAVVGNDVPGPYGFSYSQMDVNGGMTTHTASGDRVLVTETGLPPFAAPKPVVMNSAVVKGNDVPVPGPYGFSYSQMDVNGGMTTQTASGDRVLVTETGLPPFAVPKPVVMPAVVGGNDVPVPGPYGFSYSQMNVNGGMSTHTSSGDRVLITETGLPTTPVNVPSLPERNPFKKPVGQGSYSYIQVHGDGQTSFNGYGVPGPVNVVEHKPISVPPGIPIPPSSFSYKQIGEGKMTTYTGSGIYEDIEPMPAIVVHGMPHPTPPLHITDRIEKVAAGAMYNRPPYSAMPIAVPVPTGFVSVPPVHAVHPQRPVKMPTAPGTNSFVYKHVHSDGPVTSYGSDSSKTEDSKLSVPPPADMSMPFPQGKVLVFESPMYSGPFPMNPVNPNAVKPSSPVSGSYSYKMVNSGMQAGHAPAAPENEPIVDTFAPPPPTRLPAPTQGCVDPEISGPVVIDNPVAPVPLTYSYKQISHSNPNPFLVVNVEDPGRGVTTNNQVYQSLPPLESPPNLVPVDVVESNPFMQPAPFVSASVLVPQAPMETLPRSSLSYKQVTNQAHHPLPTPAQPAMNIKELKPNTFVPQTSDTPVSQSVTETTPPSSFFYKQVTSQAYQPPPPTQPTMSNFEHKPSRPPVTPPMINQKMPEIQKDNAPSSFSYKQVTSEGVYEYADQFPTGAKTNLPPSAMTPLGNPSGEVHVEQKPLPNPIVHAPVPSSPMPIPSRPAPTVHREDSLANNPIVVLETSSSPSFSFKSSNPDGSTITVKNDGQNSIAVQMEEAPKVEAVSQEPSVVSAATAEEPKMAPVLTTPAQEGTTAPVSGHARPVRRRVVKRVKPVHRGDIPDSDSE